MTGFNPRGHSWSGFFLRRQRPPRIGKWHQYKQGEWQLQTCWIKLVLGEKQTHHMIAFQNQQRTLRDKSLASPFSRFALRATVGRPFWADKNRRVSIKHKGKLSLTYFKIWSWFLGTRAWYGHSQGVSGNNLLNGPWHASQTVQATSAFAVELVFHPGQVNAQLDPILIECSGNKWMKYIYIYHELSNLFHNEVAVGYLK